MALVELSLLMADDTIDLKAASAVIDRPGQVPLDEAMLLQAATHVQQQFRDPR